MQFIKEKTVAFTGYRTDKLAKALKSSEDIDLLSELLFKEITILYHQGYDTFISGMALGFDTFAVKAIYRLKEQYPDVKLIAAVPFVGQDSKWGPSEKMVYRGLLKAADHIEIVSSIPSREAYLKRNFWMLDHASILICFFTGKPGGTASTVRRAQKIGMTIINLAEIMNIGIP